MNVVKKSFDFGHRPTSWQQAVAALRQRRQMAQQFVADRQFLSGTLGTAALSGHKGATANRAESTRARARASGLNRHI